jgi:hypothetical protein
MKGSGSKGLEMRHYYGEQRGWEEWNQDNYGGETREL